MVASPTGPAQVRAFCDGGGLFLRGRRLACLPVLAGRRLLGSFVPAGLWKCDPALLRTRQAHHVLVRIRDVGRVAYPTRTSPASSGEPKRPFSDRLSLLPRASACKRARCECKQTSTRSS